MSLPPCKRMAGGVLGKPLVDGGMPQSERDQRSKCVVRSSIIEGDELTSHPSDDVLANDRAGLWSD